MLDLVEKIKSILGLYTSEYDFIVVMFSLILILFLFSNLLGLFKTLFDFVGGRR